MILILIGGFLMALADSVPGVSGGTISFLLGFYDDFINALSNLFARKREKRIEALKFLINLGIGWIIGFILAVIVLTAVFERHIYEVSSLFLGFIICSIPIIIKEEKEILMRSYKRVVFMIIGIGIVVAITYFNPVAGEGKVVNLSQLSIGLGIYVFIVAMIAISAMILPGISGSTLLLIFGLYLPIMNAIRELIQLNFTVLPIIIIFGLGVLTGIITIIRLVKRALRDYRSQTIYTILGLMIGSLYAIYRGPTTIDVAYESLNYVNFNFVFFIIGGVIVGGLQFIKESREKRSSKMLKRRP